MKKLIMLAAGILITGGIVFAQDATPKKAEPVKKESAQTGKKEKCNLKNCVMMKDGKMMMMKDGKEMAMDNDVTLENGSRVTKDGSLISKDGKKSMLKNNDCIDMKGVWDRAPKQNIKEPVKK